MPAALLFSVLLAAAPGPAPDPVQALLGRAETALALGDVTSAARALDEALALDPDDVDVLFAAGTLARRTGRADAVTLFGHLVQLDPNDDAARLELALAQWEHGDATAAGEAVAMVLERHPDLPAALAVRETITGAAPERPTRWRGFGRLDLAAGYDSNLSLLSTALPSVSRQSVGLGLVDVVVGAKYDTAERPFSILARLSTLQALNDRASAMDSAATVVGAGVVGRQFLGGIESVLDLRYDEVFTDGFSTHRQRVLSPSLFGAVGLGESQRLRLLVGGDWHQALSKATAPDGTGIVEPSSLVGRLGLRDTIVLGRWQVMLDGLGRLASPQGSSVAPEASREVSFLELGGQGSVEAAVVDSLTAFAAAGYAHRSFRDGGRAAEQTFSGQLGLRYAIGLVELHAEYAYIDNRTSDAAWRWNRHVLFAGVRAFAP